MLAFPNIEWVAVVGVLVLSMAGCTMTPGREVALVQGPPIQDIVTPFDEALTCLRGKVSNRLTFAVGGIPDQTGTYQNSTEGAGKFVTQGAGDIVQSALFKTGVTLINRRDMGTAALEAQWGLIDLAAQRSANFVITGSINSLDFIPGGGTTFAIGGIGPSYRQNFILVGIDLAMTNAATGQILANIALRKQIFADELGLIVGRIFDEKVVDFEAGVARREAVNYALRMMLQLATYELLVQMMPPANYADCSDKLSESVGLITGDRTSAEQVRNFEEALAPQERARTEAEAASQAEAAQVEASEAPEGTQEAAAPAPAREPDAAAQARPVQAASTAETTDPDPAPGSQTQQTDA